MWTSCFSPLILISQPEHAGKLFQFGAYCKEFASILHIDADSHKKALNTALTCAKVLIFFFYS
jgi:hypothetical protein